MDFASDFIDFIDLLNSHKVIYMIVGGYAVMAHGQPRYTEDFDIWIKPSVENAEKMMFVLKEFGFVLKGLSKEDFEVEDMIVQLGYPPLRIDLMGSISGVTFDEAYENKILRTIGQSEMNFIGLNELIKNKETTGRKKDIVDAEQLKKLVIKKKK